MVFGDFQADHADVQARLFAGQDCRLTAYSVGAALSPSLGQRDDLYCGRTLNFSSGAVPNGNIVYAQTHEITSHVMNSMGEFNDVKHDDYYDFDGAQTCYRQYQNLYCSTAATGAAVKTHEVTLELQGRTLTHPQENMDVFDVTCDTLNSTSEIIFGGVKETATVLINVRGASCNVGYNVVNHNPHKVLWNFCDAETISLSKNIGGSVLAPTSAVLSEGMLDGQMVAGSHSGEGQFNDIAFDGCLPVFPSE